MRPKPFIDEEGLREYNGHRVELVSLAAVRPEERPWRRSRKLDRERLYDLSPWSYEWHLGTLSYDSLGKHFYIEGNHRSVRLPLATYKVWDSRGGIVDDVPVLYVEKKGLFGRPYHDWYFLELPWPEEMKDLLSRHGYRFIEGKPRHEGDIVYPGRRWFYDLLASEQHRILNRALLHDRHMERYASSRPERRSRGGRPGGRSSS
ncbi:MAG: hypothetical protein KKA90_02510 [Nanoarchaeota archaeon]|nr:hypothetical protein [Nanoarchaeota archaeon]